MSDLMQSPSGARKHSNTTVADIDDVIFEVLQARRVLGQPRARPAYTGIRRHIPLKASSSKTLASTTGFTAFAGSAGISKRSAPLTLSAAKMSMQIPKNPGELPTLGHEAYVREAFGTMLHLPPLSCLKLDGITWKKIENFADILHTYFSSLEDQCRYNQELEQIRWMISHCRFNIVAADDDAPQKEQFSGVPAHCGSPGWFAKMIDHTDIPPKCDLTIHLPEAILNTFTETEWKDPATDRKLTFVKDDLPVYLEVTPEEWFFQEAWGTRLDEISAGVLPGKFNPQYGKTASEGVLSALVTISVDAFHCEPMPEVQLSGDTPEQIEWNATMEWRGFTGLEAEIYVLDPWRQKMKAAGHACDKINNVKGDWVGAYVKQGAVFVEDAPRQCANFLLKMPEA